MSVKNNEESTEPKSADFDIQALLFAPPIHQHPLLHHHLRVRLNPGNSPQLPSQEPVLQSQLHPGPLVADPVAVAAATAGGPSTGPAGPPRGAGRVPEAGADRARHGGRRAAMEGVGEPADSRVPVREEAEGRVPVLDQGSSSIGSSVGEVLQRA